jgi:hypothetical protein
MLTRAFSALAAVAVVAALTSCGGDSIGVMDLCLAEAAADDDRVTSAERDQCELVEWLESTNFDECYFDDVEAGGDGSECVDEEPPADRP